MKTFQVLKSKIGWNHERHLCYKVTRTLEIEIRFSFIAWVVYKFHNNPHGSQYALSVYNFPYPVWQEIYLPIFKNMYVTSNLRKIPWKKFTITKVNLISNIKNNKQKSGYTSCNIMLYVIILNFFLTFYFNLYFTLEKSIYYCFSNDLFQNITKYLINGFKL